MVLGKLPVPGRPTVLITVGQGPTALAVGAGGGCFDIFTLIYPFSPLSPSLWERARYRLKYCLKGPLNPKPTNQPIVHSKFDEHDFLSNLRLRYLRLIQQSLLIVFESNILLNSHACHPFSPLHLFLSIANKRIHLSSQTTYFRY